MSLPPNVAEAVAHHLGSAVERSVALGGGCIAHATRIETAEGRYFLKYGRGEVAQTFPAEAAGLRALHAASSPLLIPEVLAVEEEREARPGFLLLGWIETGTPSPRFWQDFGEGLAQLHRHTADHFGFAQDNFIGRLPQRNAWETSWTIFFRDHRLEPQVQRARQDGRWQPGWNSLLKNLYRRLDDLLPDAPPASILHGDLWSGNFLVAALGNAALFDPAAYYGHQEADLAMTKLFGGFDTAFYEAYQATWPLKPGFDERRDLYNLYHLINHLNHFGAVYARQVSAILRRFG
jgi:fructosamine-3-kinase